MSLDKADIAMRRGDFKAAISILEACLSGKSIAHELLRDEALLCNINYLLSVCYQRTSGWMSAEGLRYCNKAAALAKRIGDKAISSQRCFWSGRHC